MEGDLRYNQSLLYLCMDGDDKYDDPNMMGRKIARDLIKAVPCFWTTFSVPSQLMVWISFAVYAIISLVAVAGNGLLIFMWLRQPSLRTPSNLLVISLSVSDMLMVVKVAIFMVNWYHGGPFLGLLGAKIYGVVSIISGMTAIWSIMALTMDRAYVIHSITNQSPRPNNMTGMKIIVLVIWVSAVLASLPPLFGINRFIYEGYLYSGTVDYLSPDYFIYLLLLIGYILPNIGILASHALVIMGLRKTISGLAKIIGSEDSKVMQKRMKEEKALWRKMALLLCVWLLSWSPYATCLLLSVTGQHHLINQHTDMIPAVLAKLSAAVNPILYGLLLPKVKEEIGKTWIGKMCGMKKVGAAPIGSGPSGVSNDVVIETVS